MSGPVEEVAKLEGRWNYWKLWSTLFFSYCLLRDRNFRPKRNRPITCRAVRLLVLFPHSICESMWKKERTYARGEEWVPGHSIWKPSCVVAHEQSGRFCSISFWEIPRGSNADVCVCLMVDFLIPSPHSLYWLICRPYRLNGRSWQGGLPQSMCLTINEPWIKLKIWSQYIWITMSVLPLPN